MTLSAIEKKQRTASGQTDQQILNESSVSANTTATVTRAFAPVRALALPAWMSGLQDAVLQTDMAAILDRGACAQAQVSLVFQDLVAELKAGGGALSSSQFADLKTIVANLGALGASSYTQYVANALVNGNIANATWTGGGSSAVKLGNLAAGASATALAELTGKWFLGTDNPLSTVSMSGYASFSVSYKTNAAPLFGAAGPVMNDVNQGYLGDCYLLSSMAELASQNPNAVRSLIVDNGDGTYGVRFNFGGKASYVTVDATLPNGGTIFNRGADAWVGLVEKAFAEWSGQSALNGWSGYNNSFSKIGNGGDPAYALEALTGATQIQDIGAAGSSWVNYTLNSSLNWTGGYAAMSNAAVLADIAASLLVGDDVELTSYSNAKDASGKTTLVANHAFSIYGYDALTGLLQLRNPWGTSGGANTATTFEVGLSTLLAAGDWIAIDNAGTATSASGASVVASTALQTMAQVKSFSVSDTAAHVASGLASLKSASKLTGLSVSGTGGADTLNLSGLAASASVDLGGNAGKASLSGLSAASGGVAKAGAINLGATSSYDLLTLGAGADKIKYSLGAGVLDVVNFGVAHDLLSINLNGGSLLQTIVGGSDWISSASDLSHGVLLAGVGSAQKVTISGGVATVG